MGRWEGESAPWIQTSAEALALPSRFLLAFSKTLRGGQSSHLGGHIRQRVPFFILLRFVTGARKRKFSRGGAAYRKLEKL